MADNYYDPAIDLLDAYYTIKGLLYEMGWARKWPVQLDEDLADYGQINIGDRVVLWPASDGVWTVSSLKHFPATRLDPPMTEERESHECHDSHTAIIDAMTRVMHVTMESIRTNWQVTACGDARDYYEDEPAYSYDGSDNPAIGRALDAVGPAERLLKHLSHETEPHWNGRKEGYVVDLGGVKGRLLGTLDALRDALGWERCVCPQCFGTTEQTDLQHPSCLECRDSGEVCVDPETAEMIRELQEKDDPGFLIKRGAET